MTSCRQLLPRLHTILLFDYHAIMEEREALNALSALAQPARLRVFRALVGAGPGGLTPGDIAALLGVPASTLSFHLKGLLHGGLVSQERDGRNLIYRASFDHMNALLSYLTAHCCLGEPCAPVAKVRCSPTTKPRKVNP